MARFTCRRVLVQLLSVNFVLLVSFVFISQNRVYQNASVLDEQVHHFNYQLKNFADNYTLYTIQRLGMKELKGVEALEPNFGPVINDVNSFEYLINNQVCTYFNEASRTLLVIVVSAAGNSMQRQLIRNTWGRMLAESRRFGQWAQFVFLIGSADSNNHEDIISESELYGDIIQLNMKDEYSNLSLKSVALLHWTLNYCPDVHFILKCDDDIFINVRRFITIIEQIKSFNELYGAGKVLDDPKRNQSNKYFVTHDVWPWPTYPAYLFGGAYLMGRDTIRHLLAAAQTTPYFIFEDVYLTGICTRKANISIYVSDYMYRREVPAPLDACSARNVAMWMTKTTDHFLQLKDEIDRVYDGNIKCTFECNYYSLCLNTIDE